MSSEMSLIRISMGYARAALEEGVDIFETAGNNRRFITLCIADKIAKPLIDYIRTYKADNSKGPIPKRFIIHKCVTIKHALSGQKMGVDVLSIDGFECEFMS